MTGRLSAISLSNLAYIFFREERGSRAAFHRRFLCRPGQSTTIPPPSPFFPSKVSPLIQDPRGREFLLLFLNNDLIVCPSDSPPPFRPAQLAMKKDLSSFNPAFFCSCFIPSCAFSENREKLFDSSLPLPETGGEAEAPPPVSPGDSSSLKLLSAGGGGCCTAEEGTVRPGERKSAGE